MSTTLAIDPGNIESAYVVIDAETRRPLEFGKVENHNLLQDLWNWSGADYDHAYIEMVASYGMAVGKEVFDTCVWIGRFSEAVDNLLDRPRPARLVYRRDIKLHHCGSARAKDANIIQALVDRFAPGQPNRGKGTKAAPGWFHGFHADVWQAYALAVYAADMAAMEGSVVGVGPDADRVVRLVEVLDQMNAKAVRRAVRHEGGRVE